MFYTEKTGYKKSRDWGVIAKRVFLFLLTNLAVLLVLSLAIKWLGLDQMLLAQGSSTTNLLMFSAVLGFGGAFISLAMSKWSAKWSMGVDIIDEPRNEEEEWLLLTVEKQARTAGIEVPEFGIFRSSSPNAFATGANKNKALVAVSTGLIDKMSREEVEAVIGHEIGHVANGDMVTLTLIQGVVNTFVIFLARLIGGFIDRVVFKNENGNGIGYFAVVIVCELVLGILASIIVMWFSRRREFRADTAGALLSSPQSMVGALTALQREYNPEPLPDKIAAFGINGGVAKGFKKLFLSHPPLAERVRVLRQNFNLK